MAPHYIKLLIYQYRFWFAFKITLHWFENSTAHCDTIFFCLVTLGQQKWVMIIINPDKFIAWELKFKRWFTDTQN